MEGVLLILLVGYLAATISGAAGFGGALLLLPILSNVVGIKAAVPILTIGQIFGNASRVWFGRGDLQWKPILIFLLGAIPLTILGSYFFADIDGELIKTGIGIYLILLVIYRRTAGKKITVGSRYLFVGGGLTGFLSGIAGSAGPLGAAFFLSLNLTATAYVASEAVTALTMHIVKTLIYNKFLLIGQRELYYGLLMSAAMILGSWTGRRIIEKLSRKNFIVLVEILLILSAIQFLWPSC